MDFKKLKKDVFEANLLLPEYNLVVLTWGNVSGIDRENGVIAIKPSGISYNKMCEEDIVLCDLDGKVLSGNLKPSSDLMTHIELYKNFIDIGGIVHTHSKWATSWAQSGEDILAIGTTHADYFYGSIPCTRDLTEEEISGEYELETGRVIVETFKNRNIESKYVPSVLVKSHGPFSWGKNPIDAVNNALVLEECAMMSYVSSQIKNNKIDSMDAFLLNKHFKRKHGPNAYYGQVGN